ncbi:MAG: FkbM family methyltransferase [Flavobacteriales bacterium]|jgi:FkbM family methyltransferase|nr:FkbM family methyltransferase [Flavobacteriales bacterium]
MMLLRYAFRAFDRLGLLKRMVFELPLRLSGKRLLIPMVRGVGEGHLVSPEPFMDLLIAKLVPLFPGVFLDVGVNIGQTLIKVKCAFPDQEYVGFEPNATCVDYVRRLVGRNGLTSVRLVPAGLADRDGSASLVLPSGDADDSSATLLKDLREPGAGQREVTVDLITWTAAERAQPIGTLGVVKIDVEGSELFVLQQLEKRLRQDRPITIVEVLPTYEPPDPERAARNALIEAICQRCDLRIHRIHKKQDPIRFEAIPGFGVHSHLHWSDHLLVPREREAEVLAAFH